MKSIDRTLGASWWTFVLRGVIAMLLGVVAFVVPAAMLKALAFIFAVYVIADGVTGIVRATRGVRDEGRSLAQLLGGLASLAGEKLFASAGVVSVVFGLGLRMHALEEHRSAMA